LKRILLIEDEPGIVLTLTDRLTREGYSVDSAGDGESGLERATRDAFDLLLLDLMLPRMSGFDVCKELRKRGIETPVIMLTARGQVVDKVVGLKLGADDYVTKPFEMAELLARVEAHLRRAPASPHPTEGYAFGDVRGTSGRRRRRRTARRWKSPRASSSCCGISWNIAAPRSPATSS
jgi:two-component system alkaline phosphatase synthesis response regulator PhoP